MVSAQGVKAVVERDTPRSTLSATTSVALISAALVDAALTDVDKYNVYS
jgi:hypothetical protein